MSYIYKSKIWVEEGKKSQFTNEKSYINFQNENIKDYEDVCTQGNHLVSNSRNGTQGRSFIDCPSMLRNRNQFHQTGEITIYLFSCLKNFLPT